MPDDTLSQLLYNMALRDSFDGVGRLLVSDVKHDVDRNLTVDKIIAVWKQHYPKYTIEQRSNNVLLIYWDGLEDTKGNRSTRTPVNIA